MPRIRVPQTHAPPIRNPVSDESKPLTWAARPPAEPSTPGLGAEDEIVQEHDVVEPGTDIWVNVWLDFNRDGDWDDTVDCPGGRAPEWAVQNQTIVGLPVGLNTVTSLSFRPYLPLHVQEDDPIWMRITISDVQFPPLG